MRSRQSEDTTALFYQMIARLSQLSDAAEPTPFHQILRVLDERRRLLRVYTQNIDALEEKSGITFGVPGADSRGIQRASQTRKAPAHITPATEPLGIARPDASLTNRTPSPRAGTPKCIPLHGSLQLMHCEACTHSFLLRDYIDSLVSGVPPLCPQCTALEEKRQLTGKRSHSIGKLRPSVVLYNEAHKDGEAIGSIVQKDLSGCLRGKGHGAVDLLLVVGTSLQVSGTKRMVREFSKAARFSDVTMNVLPDLPADKTMLSGPVSPIPSPHRCAGRDEKPPIRAIYLNLEFPGPARDWEGVFDVWVCGDAQAFAKMVYAELEKEERVKEAAKERKRKREETTTDKRREGDRVASEI